MGYLALISIIILAFYLEEFIRKKWTIPKRSWGFNFKRESKRFAIIFYIILIAYVIFPFIYPDANLFLIYPFAGVSVSLMMGSEQFIYKRENRLFITYLYDAFVWLVLGITANILFN